MEAGVGRPIAAALPAPRVLWAFARPHTLIVTWTSIIGIYAIAASSLPGVALGDGLGDLALTLLAGALVNVYIVGLNQCEDVHIDRVNKPHLPLAAGTLTMPAAWAVVAGSGAVAVAMAFSQGWVEVLAVGAALAIGTAYSSPPLRLKRYPAVAAVSISIVRAFAVNLGVYFHFAASLGERPGVSALPDAILALTLFVLPFAFAIAVLKDVPDAEGDRRYAIGTFTVTMGARRAFGMGIGALVLGYLGMAAAGPLLIEGASPWLLAVGHLACLAVLLALASRADPGDREGFTRFYLQVWGLFFLEYLLVPLAVVLG